MPAQVSAAPHLPTPAMDASAVLGKFVKKQAAPTNDEGKDWAERRRELGRLKTKLNKAGPLAQKKHAEIMALKRTWV